MSSAWFVTSGRLLPSFYLSLGQKSLPASLIGSRRTFKTTCVQFKRCKIPFRPKYRSWEFQDEPDHTRPKDEVRTIPWSESLLPENLAEYRNKCPEFLPPYDPMFRHPLAHKIERQMMLERRSVIEIPEFYVGSIMAVTVSDPEAPGQMSRFLGICISRDGFGLRANFTLRNYIEHEGVEIRYDMYNPVLRSIEVIRLEKRLDDHLLYLRDAEPIYSTFPMDMVPEEHDPSKPVPVNPLKVKMKPKPWTSFWEYEYPVLYGIEKFLNVTDFNFRKSRQFHQKYEQFDLMDEYRRHIPEEDQLQIWSEVQEHEEKFREARKEARRKKLLVKK